MDTFVIVWEVRLGTRGHCVPALAVFVKVKIFAPLNQVVNLVLKVVILQLKQLVVVKGVLVKGLKLLLEPL